MQLTLGTYQSAVDAALKEMQSDDIIKRIWEIDHTVWQDDPTEISNRLGWLTSVGFVRDNMEKINALVKAVQDDGYTHALLLGMGGSSLAPEVFRLTYGVADKHLDLAVLDSTDPGAVLAYADKLDPAKTLYIVATKSGGTAETLSFFKFFYNQALDKVGEDEVGQHFVAITDPGSKLVKLAKDYKFRETFENDPNIGGRYSALSFFGTIPAALGGVDLDQLLKSAEAAMKDAKAAPDKNDAAQLGAAMGELAKADRDKLTLVLSPEIASFGDWVEQLIAESTGKSGTGILPVVGEPLGAPSVYNNDRVFAYIRLDDTYDDPMAALAKAGHPVVQIDLQDKYDLGGQFFLWEMATAVAGYRMNIQPFDQPNVESAKVAANQMIAEFQEKGKLPELNPAFSNKDVTVYGNVEADSASAALEAFMQNAQAKGTYVSLHAYVQPTDATSEALANLQKHLRDTYKTAVTVGYGPRFLHSTGQLHKGDSGKGLFIQFTADVPKDAGIPDEAGKQASGMSFGTLKLAQSLGDRQALLDNHRRVLRFHFKDATAGIKGLASA